MSNKSTGGESMKVAISFLAFVAVAVIVFVRLVWLVFYECCHWVDRRFDDVFEWELFK